MLIEKNFLVTSFDKTWFWQLYSAKKIKNNVSNAFLNGELVS